MTGSEKKNLAAGIREMRSVAKRLTQWADDLEKYGENNPYRPDGHLPLKGEACAGTAPPEDAVLETPEVQAPTLAEVITFLTDVCAAGYSGQVKKLLASYGADIVSEVPEEKFGELMAKARELGEAGDGDAG